MKTTRRTRWTVAIAVLGLPALGSEAAEGPPPPPSVPPEIIAMLKEHLGQWRTEGQITAGGETIPNEAVTEAAPKGKSYAYAADTLYNECIATKVKGVDMLYHETTYLKDLQERADKRFHSTTVNAANIARKAEVNRLLIGHFSSKYDKLEEFQHEAREIFPNTDLALEGVTYRV